MLRRLVLLLALVCLFSTTAAAGDISHPSLPYGVHYGEPLLRGQAPACDPDLATINLFPALDPYGLYLCDALGVNGTTESMLNLGAYGGYGAGKNVTTGTISAGSRNLVAADVLGMTTGIIPGGGILVFTAGLAPVVAAPSTGTISHFGVAGSTTWGYKEDSIECLSYTNCWGHSLLSAEATTTTGNATLSNAQQNYNVYHGSAVSGATYYAGYRTTGPLAHELIYVGTDPNFVDYGQTSWWINYAKVDFSTEVPTTPPTTAGNNWLNTTVDSVDYAAKTFKLHDAATSAVTGAVVGSNETGPIQAMFDRLNSFPGGAWIPHGTHYYCGAPMPNEQLSIHASGNYETNIELCPISTLFQTPAETVYVRIAVDNLGFLGGKGYFQEQGGATTATASANFKLFFNDQFLGFSDIALGTTSTDSPWWRILSNYFFGLDQKNSRAIILSGTGGSLIQDNEFERYAIGITEYSGGLNDTITSNTFIGPQVGPNTSYTAAIWYPPSVANTGPGHVNSNNKFGNEGNMPWNMRILIDDIDRTNTFTSRFTNRPLHKESSLCTITSGAATLVCPDSPFLATDCFSGGACTGPLNKPIVIEGAGVGGSTLNTTIINYTSATTVTVGDNAVTTVALVNGFGATMRTVGTETATGCSIENGSTALTCTGAHFGTIDDDKTIRVPGAGVAAADLVALMLPGTTVTATTITLNTAASTAVSNTVANYAGTSAGVLVAQSFLNDFVTNSVTAAAQQAPQSPPFITSFSNRMQGEHINNPMVGFGVPPNNWFEFVDCMKPNGSQVFLGNLLSNPAQTNTLNSGDPYGGSTTNCGSLVQLFDPRSVLAGQAGTLQYPAGLNDANYTNLLTTAITAFTTSGSATITGTTDFHGGANAATVRFVLGGPSPTGVDFVYAPLTASWSYGTGAPPIWFEFDSKVAASTPLVRFVGAVAPGGSLFNPYISQSVEIPGGSAPGWQHTRLRFLPPDSGSTPVVGFHAVVQDGLTSTYDTGRIIIANPCVYQNTEPIGCGYTGVAAPLFFERPVTFANLGAITGNAMNICSDCKSKADGATPGSTCANAGTGALFIRLNGVNTCY